jgi:hypothetical protein
MYWNADRKEQYFSNPSLSIGAEEVLAEELLLEDSSPFDPLFSRVWSLGSTIWTEIQLSTRPLRTKNKASPRNTVYTFIPRA